jgi:hypothetical protein
LKSKSKSKTTQKNRIPKEKENKQPWQKLAELELQEPYSLRHFLGSCIHHYDTDKETIREKAEREGEDPEFAIKLHKIDRLHRVIDYMMNFTKNALTYGKDGMSKEQAKAEINQMYGKNALTIISHSLLVWIDVWLNNDLDHLSKEEIDRRTSLEWMKKMAEYQLMMLELEYLMKSLTPEQRDFILKRDRKRMLAKERRKRGTSVEQ